MAPDRNPKTGKAPLGERRLSTEEPDRLGEPWCGFLSSGVGGTSLRVSESMHDLRASINLQRPIGPIASSDTIAVVDLRQLSALVAVDDHGSFSAAARALYTVQSNISAHIAHLERELGVTLVDRAKGRLTPEGVVVVARARRIQRELEALSADATSMGQEVTGETRLGVIGTTARWLVPQLLVRRARRPPAGPGHRPRGQHHLPRPAAGHRPPRPRRGQPAGGRPRDRLRSPVRGGAGPAGDAARARWPTESRCRFADLAGHPLVLPPKGTALRQDLDAEARRTGVTLVPQAEIDGVRLMASLAFEGYGSTIVPTTAVPGWFKGTFTRIPITDMARRQVGLARRRRTMLSAAGRAAAEVLQAVIADKGPRQKGVQV